MGEINHYTKGNLDHDIIFHIPTRMTIGDLMNAFGPLDTLDQLKEKLDASGFERMEDETMYNGLTGEKMKCQVFISPSYYQNLR